MVESEAGHFPLQVSKLWFGRHVGAEEEAAQDVAEGPHTHTADISERRVEKKWAFYSEMILFSFSLFSIHLFSQLEQCWDPVFYFLLVF